MWCSMSACLPPPLGEKTHEAGMLMKRRITASLGALLMVLPGAGCGEEAPAAAPPAAAAVAAVAPATATGGALDTSVATLQDNDFVENEGNRDPFRSYANAFQGKAPTVAQRSVLMPNTPIESMRLIAIISGLEQPRAMLVDEKGVGHVTRRGDFVGRAEVVQSGGAENLAITINWRIDRIRDNEVVLAREDPTGPNRPPLTRVIPLHEKEEGEDEG